MPKCCELLIQAIHDLEDNAEDTVWLTDMETVVDRLILIYSESGGDMDQLRKEFPHYAV